ncbi:hypothetical protein [Nocardiopsis lambiniae]|uniref:Uncharacterized protein n=1 Tax=Nocardiopsis lambiniae TaxID=3075539 RepID=A0ABU2MBI7_9ACTN|nr:hypothetical protein [Nocardiopsis sp. DSM 44743]MDT0330047.1 hypothetical protein [Nocardiopsis sp. DSM 44743]
MHDPATTWRRSPIGELCWSGGSGPHAIPVVPLVEDVPCVALPLAHLPLIASLGRWAAFCVSAPPAEGEPAMAAVGRVEVSLDPRGEAFADLVEQEVHKHPPTRLRVGSLMARRENWWWMGRAIVRLVDVDRVVGLPPRDRPEDALLVRGRDGDLRVEVVTSPAWPTEPGSLVELWGRNGDDPSGSGEPALVMGHQASPDFERWERWTRRGELTGQSLTLAEADGDPDPDPRPFGLLERWNNHHRVRRACVAGVAEAERRLRG